MQSRRICLVSETFTPEINGVANTLANLCRELKRARHDVAVVRPVQRNEPVQGDQSVHGERHYRVTGWPLPGYPELRFGWPSRRRLRRFLRKERPEAIYIATQGPLGWITASLAIELGIRTVSGFHTNFHQYSRYYGAGFLENLIRRYLVAFHNRTGATLAPTSRVCREIQNWGVNNVHRWSRGVDSRLFRPDKRSASLRQLWDVDSRDPAVLYVGRLAAEKNLMQAVTTFERLKSFHPGARFILVGDGPLREKLQRRHPDYHFCGIQTGDALARHYASADIFLFPSQSETFGNVVTEAMASGLAVVAFDQAAAHEHIRHRTNGILVDPDDSAGFSHETLSLADQPTLMKSIRHRARFDAESLDWAVLRRSFERHLILETEGEQPNGTKQSIAGF